ncbi:MAG: hypothetical protein AAFN10_07015 [Bacteroidota bacterium]
MERILYEEKTATIRMRIVVYESDEGKIVVHGHDIGEMVKKLKDKDDYEYFLTIEEEEVSLLKEKLGQSTTAELLNLFEQEYSTDKAVSQIQKRLESLGVKSQFSSW